MLLLHGWPTSSYLWREVMVPIAEANRVVAIDLPGFGASDKPLDRRYDFDLFLRAIDGLLAELGIERTGLVAHDLGGPIGVRWTLDNPTRVSKLALLNTLVYPGEPSGPLADMLETLADPDRYHELTGPEGLETIMRLGVADPSRLTPEVLAAVVEPFRTAEAQQALAVAGTQLSPDGLAEIARRLPELTMPVALIYGALDPAPPGRRRVRPHPDRTPPRHRHRPRRLQPLPPRRCPRPPRHPPRRLLRELGFGCGAGGSTGGGRRRTAAELREEAEMPDVAMRIELPEAPPSDLPAFVLDELGVLPDVAGPKRGLSDLAPALVFVTESFVAGLIGSKGEKALTTVVARLRRRTETGLRSVELIRDDGRPALTFILDEHTDRDPDAVQQLLALDRSTAPHGSRLRWDPSARRWVVDGEQGRP